MNNEAAYSRPVTLKSILRFAVPTIAMSVFMSFYTMVDVLFVSNLIGTNALSSINLVYPIIALVTAISTMLATGGSAAIMKKVGEAKRQEANEDFTVLIIVNVVDEAMQDFTFLIIVNIFAGLVMCGIGYLFMGNFFSSMSLSAEVSDYCREYLSCYLLFTVPILLMNNFTLYMIAAGKATLSLLCSVAGGIANIMLDYLFIAVFHLGIGGAAVATGLGYSITAVVGFFVFSKKNSLLHFVKPVCRFKVLGNVVTNGCSEMAAALVNGIITLMFNWAMLKYVGQNGVAAITIISYVLALAGSLYAGYTYGVAPMISFYYGERNHGKLKRLIRTSLIIIGTIAVATVIVSLIVTEPLVSIFARPGSAVFDLAVQGNRICSLALLFVGFNIFASGMFTALSNGIISAVLAFSRTFVFTMIAMLILPAFFDVIGIWLATPAAELMAVILACFMFFKYRKRYHY